MAFGFYPQFEFIRATFTQTARRLWLELESNAEDLLDGDIGVTAFRNRSNYEIRVAYLEIYTLGAMSVDPFHITTSRDIQILEHEIVDEGRFLARFARDIRNDRIVMPLDIRTMLYAKALRGIFERGRAEALPPGPFAWDLGEGDSCTDCIRAATSGPYQRTVWDGLGLPALPGAPGDGSVCHGLTSCTCTLRFIPAPVPNMEVQHQLAGWLEDLTNDGADIRTTGGVYSTQVAVS